MLTLIVLIAQAFPTGVTENTTLGTFGPVVFVLVFVAGLFAIYLRLRSYVRSESKEWAESKEGKEILDAHARSWLASQEGRTVHDVHMTTWLTSREGKEVIDGHLWSVVKSEDFTNWVKGKVEHHSNNSIQTVLLRLGELTKVIGGLSDRLDKVVTQLEEQNRRQLEEIRMLERRQMQTEARVEAWSPNERR